MLRAFAEPASELPPASPTLWVLFLVYLALLGFIDLYVLNRQHDVPTLRKSIFQVLFFVGNALAVGLIGLWLFADYGAEGVGQYVAAYTTEWSLSVDNIFVIALIMTRLGIPKQYRHQILFWGILGAIVLRMAFITGGLFLVEKLAFTTAIMGLFLLFTSYKVARSDDEVYDIKTKWIYRAITRVFPTTKELHGGRFFTTHENDQFRFTRLFICVLAIETSDVIFAFDSIPTVLAITAHAFIAFSSNMMAILGLRSVYFLFGYFEDRITRLNEGLSIILAFVSIKMIIGSEWAMRWFGQEAIHIATWISLTGIVVVLIGSFVASRLWPKKEEADLAVFDEEEIAPSTACLRCAA